jgi:hypothetical protein
MNKRTWLIVGGVVLALFLCVCLAVAGFVVYNLSAVAKDVSTTVEGLATEIPAGLSSSDLAKLTADSYLGLWKSGAIPAAYELGSAEFKAQVGSADQLAEILNGTGLELDSWVWESTDQLELQDTGRPVWQLKGTATFADGSTGPVEVQLIEEDGRWMVLYFDIKG